MITPRTMKFKGEFRINQEIISETVSVYISNGVIFLSDERNRRKLVIRTFNLSMMLIYYGDSIAQDFEYHIKGTEIGYFDHGPLGHPGDNEINKRKVLSVDIVGSYNPDGLKLEFSGETSEGKCGFGTGQILPAWLFDLSFCVPKSEIQEFLQKTDQQYANYSHLLPA